MAERLGDQRPFWLLITLSIVLLVVLIVVAYAAGLDGILRSALGSGVDEVILPDPGIGEAAEVVVIDTPTLEPSPTATDTPTPTLEPTATFTPSVTPTTTSTPYPTPELSWTERDLELFLSVWYSGGIHVNIDFLRKFQCTRYGQDWSEDVDPFVVQYFSDVQVCTCIEDENVPDQWYVPYDVSEVEGVEESGKHWEDYRYCPIPTERTSGWSYGDPWRDPEIPAWERCLFLERNFHIYGKDNYKQAEWVPGQSGEGMYSYLLPYYESRLGSSGRTLYCPNFDSSHPLYLIESGDEEESE